jgi:hypothetical protein
MNSSREHLLRGYRYDPEEVPMTLQIVLTGTDGIVLASDKKVNLLNQNFNTTAMRSKILINHDRKIAACWSGEQWPSYNLADHIVRNMSDADLQYPYDSLRTVAPEIVNRRGIHGEEYASAEVAVVTIQDGPKAYEITASRDRCDCWAQEKIIRGHIANPAVFFTERYYEQLPIARLLPLAAHVIVNAGRINPRGIEGLEIVRCTKEGFVSLEAAEIAELMDWSDKMDREIKQLLSRLT